MERKTAPARRSEDSAAQLFAKQNFRGVIPKTSYADFARLLCLFRKQETEKLQTERLTTHGKYESTADLQSRT